jgi:hypothetical protein
MSIANRDARVFVDSLEPFKANNIFAENTGPLYVVYSYGHHWPMFVFNRNTRQWYTHDDRYSRTTSKHRGQAMPTGLLHRLEGVEKLQAYIDAHSTRVRSYVSEQ